MGHTKFRIYGLGELVQELQSQIKRILRMVPRMWCEGGGGFSTVLGVQSCFRTVQYRGLGV